MLSRYTSLTFVRGLRTPNKRTASNFYKLDKPATALSENDLQKLAVRDHQVSFNEASSESDPLQIYPRSIDKTKEAFVEEEEADPKSFKKSKKKTFFTLKKMRLQHPLTEAPTEENHFEKLSEAVTPLYQMPYQKQLKLKQKHTENILQSLRKKLKEVGAPMSSFGERLPCPLENIIPSPELMNYRNKDEFSVNVGVDGNPKTVGYYYGLPVDPNMRCIPPTHLINIKESHKLVAKHFETYIRSSPHSTCLKFSDGGVWRTITVRSNLKEELMAIVTIFPTGLSPEDAEELRHSLRHYFFEGPGAECRLDSLYLQACPHSKCTREMAPFELLAGKTHLEEGCLGRSFQISPDSFFQTNTGAAELLYSSIEKVAELSSLTTLLDVCCGTGTISVLLAPQCRGTIGIDATSASIEDAKVNARNNGIKNANYICGKIEKILPILTKDLQDVSDVVAIVNPARAGLHPSVVEGIRRCESIKKLIFVTCKPEGGALHNMAMLGTTLDPSRWMGVGSKQCRTKDLSDPGDPFILRYAIPIDLFPHTLHVEHVFLFERVGEY